MGKIKQNLALTLLVVFSLLNSVSAQNTRQYAEDGLRLYQEERYYQAIDSLRRAIDANPYYGDAYRYLAQVYFDMGEHELSLDNAMSALKYSHQDIRAMLIVGNSYRELGQYQKAESYLLQVQKQFPSNPAVYRDMGELYILMNRKDQALRMLEKAMRLDPEDWKNHNSMAHYYLYMDKTAQAEQSLQKALALNSRERATYLNLATFYYNQNRLDQAVALLEKGESLFENFVSGVTLLGDSYLRLKNYKSALEKYKWLEERMAAATKKQQARLFYKIALASEEGDKTQVIRYYQKALGGDPDNQLFRYSMEEYIIKSTPLKDPLRETAARDHVSMAHTYYQKGSMGMFFLHLKRAVYLYPFLSQARAELVSYHEKNGDYYSAYQELKGQFKVDQSTSVKDKLESYDWKIQKGQMTLNPLKLYEFQALFVTEDLPGKLDDVLANMCMYMTRNYLKFKLLPLVYRKTDGLNRIIQEVREKKLNFFVIAEIQEEKSAINFVLFDRLGKKLNEVTMYFTEYKLEETVTRFYQWLNGEFPDIASLNKKISARQYQLSMGLMQGLKTGDKVLAYDLESDLTPAAEFEVLKSEYSISTVEIRSNSTFNINDFVNYGILKDTPVNKKLLTKLKRILVY